MGRTYKKNSGRGVLFGLAFLLIVVGCSGLKRTPEDTGTKIKGGREILVVRDIGRGWAAPRTFWCGNDAVVAYNKIIGIELIRIPTGERVKVSPNKDDYLFNCSPGGEWVVYMDFNSGRSDKPGEDKPLIYDGKPFEFHPDLDVWPAWEGGVADLYRYEVATGKKERFAVVRSDTPAWEVVSPDGKKAFLGSTHNSSIEMPEPKWQAMWFTREDWDWSQTYAVWFKDSSGVVSFTHGPNKLFVEFFGEGGWTKRFILSDEFEDNIEYLTVDGENRIYFRTQERGFGRVDQRGGWLLHRCEIKDKELSCEMVLKRDNYIYSYEVLPGGDIIFNESNDNCIRRTSPGQAHAECVVGGKYPAVVPIIGISPDGEHLAYTIYNDLYVIELTGE